MKNTMQYSELYLISSGKKFTYAINMLTSYVSIIEAATMAMSFSKREVSQALPEIQTCVSGAKNDLMSVTLSMLIWWRSVMQHYYGKTLFGIFHTETQHMNTVCCPIKALPCAVPSVTIYIITCRLKFLP